MHTGKSGSSASGRFDQQEGDTSQVSTSVRQENDALSTGQGDNSASPGSAASGSASSGSGADSSLSTVENTGSSADQNAADACMVTMLQKGISNPKKIISWYDQICYVDIYR
jgi:hypothetical protein